MRANTPSDDRARADQGRELHAQRTVGPELAHHRALQGEGEVVAPPVTLIFGRRWNRLQRNYSRESFRNFSAFRSPACRLSGAVDTVTVNFGVCSATRVGPTSAAERPACSAARCCRPSTARRRAAAPGRRRRTAGRRRWSRRRRRRGTAGCRRRGRRCRRASDVGGVVPDDPRSGRRARSRPPSRRPRRRRPPTGRRPAPRAPAGRGASSGGQHPGAAAEVQRRAGRRGHPVQRTEQRAGCRCRSSRRRTPRRARRR